MSISPKTCLQCGKDFTPDPAYPQKRFCSRQCSGKDRRKKVDPTFACEYCGKTVTRQRGRFANGKEQSFDYTIRFCSRECGYKGRRTRPINPKGHEHGGTGYMRVNVRGGGHMLLHRKTMQDTLGRDLRSGETVHHLNGDRKDNRPENLELWTKRQPAGQRVIDKVAFAIEMLRLYPEFARDAGVGLVDL